MFQQKQETMQQGSSCPPRQEAKSTGGGGTHPYASSMSLIISSLSAMAAYRSISNEHYYLSCLA